MTIFTSYLIYELLFVSWLPAASGCQNVQFALLNKFCDLDLITFGLMIHIEFFYF